jgi:hypothetical protein
MIEKYLRESIVHDMLWSEYLGKHVPISFKDWVLDAYRIQYCPQRDIYIFENYIQFVDLLLKVSYEN